VKLFFYGVLMDHVARGDVRDRLAGLGPGQPATAVGRLYAVPDPQGWYPALMYDAGSPDGHQPGLVHGMLHDSGQVDLAALDRFEGVDPRDPHAGDYRRAEISVTTADGQAVLAFAYLWNHRLTGNLVHLPLGDFALWLRQSGQQAFAGG